MITLGILSIVGVVVLSCGLFTVSQQSLKVVERFGKFLRIADPGLNFKIPLIDWIAGELDLRVEQLTMTIETKTADNVFVDIGVNVQFYILPDKAYDAFYQLTDDEKQIQAYVFDVVRATVPKVKLDDLFEKKDEIAEAVKNELSETMSKYGYCIERALVVNIVPEGSVQQAMNAINANARMRVAAQEKGEADKILIVKQAEADAESKRLQGKGVADQRREIINGLRESVEEFQQSIPGASAQDVMSIILMTQYFDMLKEVGHRSSAVLIPHSPGALSDLASQIRTSILSANMLATGTPNGEIHRGQQ